MRDGVPVDPDRVANTDNDELQNGLIKQSQPPSDLGHRPELTVGVQDVEHRVGPHGFGIPSGKAIEI